MSHPPPPDPGPLSPPHVEWLMSGLIQVRPLPAASNTLTCTGLIG
jgi:hypothetical protein